MTPAARHPHPPDARWVDRRQALALAAAAAAGCHRLAQAQSGTGETAIATTVDETWSDPTRRRELPVRLRWPAEHLPLPPGGRPVVVFSHGLGGTRAGGELWGQAWAAAGLVAVHLQHPGSDLAAVRSVARDFTDRSGLQRLIGPAQALDRLHDVVFVLDELARRRAAGTGPWASVRPQAVGLAGHSFGAHTTLGMAGQRYPGHPGINEPRLAAFIAFSPTLPAVGDPVRAFDRLTRPMLSITGTRDDDVVGVGATPQRRMGVYGALPAGNKAHLVLEDGDHMTFAGQTGRAVEIVPRSQAARSLQARHHALLAAITSDWWRWRLMDDPAAQSRLTLPAGLAAGDLWQTG